MTKRRAKIAILFLFSWFVVHEATIIIDGLNDESADANIAVVFGSTVNTDGTLSERLKARLDKGVDLYKDAIVSELFVSGGLGKEGFYEGDKMAEYLVSQDVPEQAITIDNDGNTTRLTAENFVQHFPAAKSAILVSQYHHISRAKLAFRQTGIKNAQGVHCHYFEIRDVYSCFREFFAYYKYLFINSRTER